MREPTHQLQLEFYIAAMVKFGSWKAMAAKTGIHKTSLSHIYRGRRLPTMKQADIIEKALGKSTYDLFNIEKKKLSVKKIPEIIGNFPKLKALAHIPPGEIRNYRDGKNT